MKIKLGKYKIEHRDIILFLMVMGLIFTYIQTVNNEKLIEKEILIYNPYLVVSEECGPEINGTISIKAPIENKGKTTASLAHMFRCINISCGEGYYQGEISLNLPNIIGGEEAISNKFGLGPGDKHDYRVSISTKGIKSKKPFSIIIEYVCLNEKCTFSTSNLVNCSYVFDGERYMPQTSLRVINTTPNP